MSRRSPSRRVTSNHTARAQPVSMRTARTCVGTGVLVVLAACSGAPADRQPRSTEERPAAPLAARGPAIAGAGARMTCSGSEFRGPFTSTVGATNGSTYGAAEADFNGDGKVDVALGTYVSTGEAVVIMLGKGDGTFTTGGTFPTGTDVAYSTCKIRATDFNGDGHLDLVVGGKGAASVLLGAGDGTFGTPLLLKTGKGTLQEIVAVTDFNGDGFPDVAAPTFAPHGVVTFLGKGDGTFEKGVLTTFKEGNSYTDAQDIVASDFNGDGIRDLVVMSYDYHNVEGPETAVVLLGVGDGTFTPSHIQLQRGSSVAAARLRAGAHEDLVVTNGYTATVNVSFGKGDGKFGKAKAYSTGAYPTLVEITDFDGDGAPDLVAAGAPWPYCTKTTCPAGPATVLLNDGTGGFPTKTEFTLGISPYGRPVVADFDGDGTQDFAVSGHTKTGSEVVVFLNNGCTPP